MPIEKAITTGKRLSASVQRADTKLRNGAVYDYMVERLDQALKLLNTRIQANLDAWVEQGSPESVTLPDYANEKHALALLKLELGEWAAAMPESPVKLWEAFIPVLSIFPADAAEQLEMARDLAFQWATASQQLGQADKAIADIIKTLNKQTGVIIE
ncbi:hypothetical protein GC177_01425 [bacterium]|nr:hypothetical protein [bacterium]